MCLLSVIATRMFWDKEGAPFERQYSLNASGSYMGGCPLKLLTIDVFKFSTSIFRSDPV